MPANDRERRRAASKRYRASHRDELRARRKAYREAHLEEVRAYSRAYSKVWRLAHPEQEKATKKEYRKNHREQVNVHNRAYRATRREYRNALEKANRDRCREEVLQAYGGKCACCGETEIKFLAIDHMDGGGRKHREDLGVNSGGAFYQWIKKNNYPTNLQLLCHNCNMAKGVYGECPHVAIRARPAANGNGAKS